MMDTPETQASTDPKAAISVQAMLRSVIKGGGEPWVLKTDFSKYFASIDRARHKLAAFEKSGDLAARNQFLASWRGHAQWADCRNLLTHLGVTQ